jgi:hypothetical protein
MKMIYINSFWKELIAHVMMFKENEIQLLLHKNRVIRMINLVHKYNLKN